MYDEIFEYRVVSCKAQSKPMIPDSTLVEEGFVRHERPDTHTINLPKCENVLYSRNNSIFVSFVTLEHPSVWECAQVLDLVLTVLCIINQS